jgi:UPF0176 protein
MSSIVNVAAYQFSDLTNLAELRDELRQLCKGEQLRGTILLSPEGINLFVAGTRQGVDQLLMRLRQIPALADLEVKESLSNSRPFNRMLVKIKKEIIPFGVEGIDPRRYTSRRLPPRELKRWLDEGRPIILLDTRNNFEFQTGTFKDALAIGVDDFRNFPEAVRRLPENLKRQTIVTFCTGGIRCEKASPFLEAEGFRDVYQLHGGILKYLEECGGAHYQGHCFVFDKRVAVDATLQEGGLRQCYVCQAILSVDEQTRPQYVEGKACPRCYQSAEFDIAERIRTRNLAISKAATPLPGSTPYDNVRPISVPLRCDGAELLDFLDAMDTHLSRDQWRQICENGSLVCRNEPVRPGRTVRAGERFLHCMPATIEPEVNGTITILHEDESIVVVNKPAPLPMHPCGRFNRNTLTYILGQAFDPICLRAMHRLDADTSGVVVFSKTLKVARQLQPQFESGDVIKTYLARAQGRPAQFQFECHLPLSNVPGPGGARVPDVTGAKASTWFEMLRDFGDGTVLLLVKPATGRTNQIRAHAWSLKLPIVGDPIYLPDGKLGPPKTLAVTDPPLCLHAESIEFIHPESNKRTRCDAPAPPWSR